MIKCQEVNCEKTAHYNYKGKIKAYCSELNNIILDI